MKKLCAMVVCLLLCVALSSVVSAEEKGAGINFADYLGTPEPAEVQEERTGMNFADYLGTPEPAEASAYQPELLAGLADYEYDRFEQRWTYTGAYVKRYGGLDITIGLALTGSGNTCAVPMMWVEIVDVKRGMFYLPSSIQWLVDGKIFSFSHLTEIPEGEYSYCDVGDTAVKLLDALKGAEDVAVKVSYKNDTYDVIIDPVSKGDLAGLADWKRNTDKAGVWGEVSGQGGYQSADTVFAASVR